VLENMTCCSARAHDTSFIARIASGNALACSFGNAFGIRAHALALGVCLYFLKSIGNVEMREFWNRESARRKCERAGHMDAVCPEAMGSGSFFLFHFPFVILGRASGSETCMGMCGG